MKSTFCRIAVVPLLLLLVAGCATNPAGEATQDTRSAAPPVTAHYLAVRFQTPQLGIKSKDRVVATASVEPIDSVLAYKYTLSSKVNGNYFLLPDPPKIYTIVKTPYYKKTSSLMRFHVEIYNRSDLAILPGRAVAAVDVNGKTVFESDILIPGVLPEHRAELTIDGPAVGAGGKLPAKGSLRFGIYQVHVGDQVENFWWDTGYASAEGVETLPATVVLRTPRETEARQALAKLQAQPQTISQ